VKYPRYSRLHRRALGLCSECGDVPCDPWRICDGCRAVMAFKARQRYHLQRAARASA
jgi:hypothetical protein